MKDENNGASLRLNIQTDDQLMLAVRNGDIDKLGILFENYHKQLYNYFFRHTSDAVSSEDLVQDVFFRILKYRYNYRGDGKFTTWMFQIARNVQIDYFKKKYRDKETKLENEQDILNDDPDPHVQLEKTSEVTLLREALSKLSDKKREVLILSRFHNLKYAEISDILGIKVGTIKALVFRTLKELSTIYSDLSGESENEV